uniref:Haloacid dehalogenase-like hydrolase family protein n=1 Tax=Arundo donax TaxID=35708 RepID=A0A0A8YT25_ARUDO
MHSGTPFWSLSSTAVAPRRSKSLSVLSAAASIFSSRSALTVVLAELNFSLNSLYSFSSKIRYAKTKVLRPESAYSFMCLLVSSSNFLPVGASLLNITLSAPLLRSNILPSGSLTITDIRFLELLNSNIFRSSYFLSTGAFRLGSHSRTIILVWDLL